MYGSMVHHVTRMDTGGQACTCPDHHADVEPHADVDTPLSPPLSKSPSVQYGLGICAMVSCRDSTWHPCVQHDQYCTVPLLGEHLFECMQY